MNYYSCEICGQGDLASEQELRAHANAAHVSGSAECPFCDLGGIAPDEMAAHVAAAHADADEPSPVTPDADCFLEDGGGSGGEIGRDMRWLEERAREGPQGEGENNKAATEETSSAASPMSTGTDFSSVGSSATTIQGLDNEDERQAGSPQRQQHRPQGAIQKRPRASADPSPPTKKFPRPLPRSKMTLDVRPTFKEGDTLQSSSLTCPMCPHRERDPAKMEEHVNRRHFDLTSPAEISPSTSSFSCPICSMVFGDPGSLQRHVNGDHGDVLSPNRPSTTTRGNEEQQCPVCFRYRL